MLIPKFIIDQNIINNEIKLLNNLLNQQRQLKKVLLVCLEEISISIRDAKNTNSIISYITNIQKISNNIKDNINQIIDLKKFLENLFKDEYLDSVNFEKYNEKYLIISTKISNDNVLYYSFMKSLSNTLNTNNSQINSIIDLENTIISILNQENISSNLTSILENYNKKNIIKTEDNTNSTMSIDDSLEQSNTTISTENTEQSINNIQTSINNNSSSFVERTLFIHNDYIILPYSITDLEEFFSNNPEKYSCIQDIIDKEYTISSEHYKKTYFSRFKETFYLAKNKSNLSFFKSFTLACKSIFYQNLNPIIISACKNIDEFNLYLNCEKNNSLNTFSCFKILYI